MVQQVLMRLVGDVPTFETHDNPRSRSPLSFEDPTRGLRIPRLGTQDILRIAAFAPTMHYALDGFQLADRTMTPLPESLADTLSRKLAKQIKNGRPAADVEDFLREEWPGVVVTGVTLTTPELSTARLQRQGVLWAPGGWSPTRFLSDAWQAVRFW